MQLRVRYEYALQDRRRNLTRQFFSWVHRGKTATPLPFYRLGLFERNQDAPELCVLSHGCHASLEYTLRVIGMIRSSVMALRTGQT
jgi:hypothetical protein